MTPLKPTLQNSISATPNRWLGHCVKLARLLYMVVIGILIAPTAFAEPLAIAYRCGPEASPFQMNASPEVGWMRSPEGVMPVVSARGTCWMRIDNPPTAATKGNVQLLSFVGAPWIVVELFDADGRTLGYAQRSDARNLLKLGAQRIFFPVRGVHSTPLYASVEALPGMRNPAWIQVESVDVLTAANDGKDRDALNLTLVVALAVVGLVMALFSLALRDLGYGLGGLYCVLLACSQTLLSGLSFSLFGGDAEWAPWTERFYYLAVTVGCITAIFLGGFVRHSPRKTIALYWILAINACLVIVQPFSVPTFATLTFITLLAELTLVVGAAWTGMRQGERGCLLLLIGWSPTLIYFGVLVVFGYVLTDMPRPTWLRTGSPINVVRLFLLPAMYCIILADRSLWLRREKTLAQAALVDGLKQSERELEGKVADRTAEIAELNRTLEQRVDEQVDQIGRLGKLKRFFSPQLAEVIVAGGEEALKTHRREVSVVFIDLRGFTAFTDRAEPEEVMEMLRAFHATMGRIVMEHNGTLERFAGDSVMVFFNDPVPMENHAEQAVLMALEMQAAFVTLGEKWSQRGFNLGLGCGIALGYATLGEIGFEGRWDYAAIGSVTNLAARLCAEAASGEVLVDQKMMDKVGTVVSATEKGSLSLKGFAQPVSAFVLLGLKA